MTSQSVATQSSRQTNPTETSNPPQSKPDANALPAGIDHVSWPAAAQAESRSTGGIATRVWIASLCVPAILAAALAIM